MFWKVLEGDVKYSMWSADESAPHDRDSIGYQRYTLGRLQLCYGVTALLTQQQFDVFQTHNNPVETSHCPGRGCCTLLMQSQPSLTV